MFLYTQAKKKYKSFIFKMRVIYLTRINTLLVLRKIITIQQIFTPKKVGVVASIVALLGTMIPVYNATTADSNKIMFPIKEMSKLECRFQKFSELTSSCKRDLPKLSPKDYTKYIKEGGWYNQFTRIYTVLWWASYKYGWDVGNWGHGWTDIATAEGTPVYSIADWKVINAKYMPGWWNNVSIEHVINGKKIVSNYSHLSKIHVKYWETLKVDTVIGEVGNTWNSFWNHLHFQIDLDTPSHPYYYDYEACPYSYNAITETWVCFDELEKNTLDPLVFLESNWAILDKVEYSNTVTNLDNANQSVKKDVEVQENESLPLILYTYVPPEAEKDTVKKLQELFSDMWFYRWKINGEYEDIRSTLIEYQLDSGVIESKDDDWAGYFGPKTRTQAQLDYKEYLKTWEELDEPVDNNEEEKEEIKFISTDFTSDAAKTSSDITNTIKTEKIEQTQLLTREEIAAREVKEFMWDFVIDLDLGDNLGNVPLGETEVIKFTIDKDNWRPFRGRTPSDITIETDESILSVFPNRMYEFSDGQRDIKITWKKTGVTTLKVKIWETVVETFNIKVFDSQVKIEPEYGAILSSNKITFWEEKTGFVVMKDENRRNLLNLKYEWEYKLSSDTDTMFCLKRTDLKNIVKSLNERCEAREFKSEIIFDYEDTTVGILVFDYKVWEKNANMTLQKRGSESTISKKYLTVSEPKWINDDYAYKWEVINLLEKWIVNGVSKWYFEEEKTLYEMDAFEWIQNTLIELRFSTNDSLKIQEINERLEELSSRKVWKYSDMTRQEFLSVATDYLIFSDTNPKVDIKYKDLDSDENKMANLVFDAENTWKDKFGANYYQPNEPIKRGEWAYLISRVLQKQTSNYISLK